jgi:putative ABC transport system permease protein
MATLETGEGIDAALIRRVKARPDIVAAEAHDVLQARVKVGEDWLPLLVFASATLDSLALNRFFPHQGKWPAPEGTFLLERTALPVLETRVNGVLTIKLPNTPPQTVTVSGTVHDPGLSPAYQERMGYAYATTATLASLGETAALHELRIGFAGENLTTRRVQELASRLAEDLADAGVEIHEIRVPPFERHPHQLQMETVTLMLFLFALLAFILSAVLVATTLSAWLARQTREMAIMKAIGARAGQISGIYFALVTLLGTASFLIAWPLGKLLSLQFALVIAKMLNFSIVDSHLGWGHPFVVALAGIAFPLFATWLPIRLASRSTVRDSLTDWGARSGPERMASTRLPKPMRQLLRRPKRLALALILLGASGAIFMTALNVSRGWKANLDKVWKARHYDLEVRFRSAQPDSALQRLQAAAGVLSVEPWGWMPTSFSRPDAIDIVGVWPDKGHGSLSLMGIPVATKLVTFPVLMGRRLRESDSASIMLNHIAWAQAGKPGLGTAIYAGREGAKRAFSLAGVIEEVGSPGILYVTRGVFAGLADAPGRSRMIRVATDAKTPLERSRVLRAVERVMQAENLPVQMAIPFSELKTAIGDHMKVLIASLFALSAIIGLVGILGLISVTGMNVLERGHEFGILKTVGATPRRIIAMVIQEAVYVGLMSWALGFLLSLPLTIGLDRLIGNLGFLAPLPFIIQPVGPVLGIAIVALVAAISGWVPARRAAKVSVSEALGRV